MIDQLEQERPKYLGILRSEPRGCVHQLARVELGGEVHHVCRHCGHGARELVALAVDELRRTERRRLLARLRQRGLSSRCP